MISNSYHNAIRAHIDLLVRRGRTDQVIVWRVGSDEIHDPTLIAHRVYGNRDFADIIMLCAGTNRISEPLPEKNMYLPLPRDLVQIRKRHAINQGVASG